MNKVLILGRLTKDPVVNYTPSQMAVARFSLALNRGKDKNGRDRGADYPNCVAFGRTAENIERFSGKGLRVQVEGHIQTGSYEAKDGHKVYTTDVVVDRLEFIDWKNSGQQGGSQEPIQAESPYDSFQALDEDVPF